MSIACLQIAQEKNLAISPAMQDAIVETYRRREIQHAYNIKHHITPTTIISSIKEISIPKKKTEAFEGFSKEKLDVYKKRLELEMDIAAANLDFERAAEIRDELLSIKGKK